MGLSKKGKLKEEKEAKTFELVRHCRGSVKHIQFLVLVIWKRGIIPLTHPFKNHSYYLLCVL